MFRLKALFVFVILTSNLSFGATPFEEKVKDCILYKNTALPMLYAAIGYTEMSLEEDSEILFSKLKRTYRIFGRRVDKLFKKTEKVIAGLDEASQKKIEDDALDVYQALSEIKDDCIEAWESLKFAKEEPDPLKAKLELKPALTELNDAVTELGEYETYFLELVDILREKP